MKSGSKGYHAVTRWTHPENAKTRSGVWRMKWFKVCIDSWFCSLLELVLEAASTPYAVLGLISSKASILPMWNWFWWRGTVVSCKTFESQRWQHKRSCGQLSAVGSKADMCATIYLFECDTGKPTVNGEWSVCSPRIGVFAIWSMCCCSGSVR